MSDGAVTAEQIATLMSTIEASSRRMEAKFADFKVEMKKNQEESAAKAVKRARVEKAYTFHKKGNEEQSLFNSQLDKCLAETESELSGAGATPALVRAKESLEKGKRLLAARQKLIRIADRSELGWGVVAVYTADELTDNSGDEKRLEKAEKEAERKAGKRKKKRADQLASAKKPPGVKGGFLPNPAGGQGTRFYPPGRSSPTIAIPPRALGPCFACGEMGHLRHQCPKAAGSSSRRWYPLPENVCMQVCVDGGNVEGVEHDTGCCWGGVEYEIACLVDDSGSGEDTDYVDAEEFDAAEHHREMEESNVPVVVKGKLQECLGFWKEELQAPPSVIKVIEQGYLLPLKNEPSPKITKNQVSAIANQQFIDQSLSELLQTGCVRVVDSAPHICSPLAVVEGSTGKKRLVINLRYLNQFLWKQKFKYDDLRVALNFFERGDYLFSFDLKSGYHLVDIAVSHKKYLGFEWKGVFYVFTALPFGLSSACYLFTKLLRRYWRSRGLRIVVYLDDGLCAVNGLVSAKLASEMVRYTLSRAGFVTHPTKSVWEPTQCLVWLGFKLDLAMGLIRIPDDKLVALSQVLMHYSLVVCAPARKIASVVGKIIYLGLAVSRFMTRASMLL